MSALSGSWTAGAEALALLASLFWAGDAILVRQGSRYSNAASAALLSFLAATVVLWTLNWSRLSLDVVFSPASFYFALSGLIQPVLVRLLYYTGIVRLGVSRAGPVRGTSPLFAMTIAFFFLDERLGLTAYIGVVLTVLGVWMISYRREGEADWRPFDLVFPLGAAFLAAVSQNIRKKGLLILPDPLIAVTVNVSTSVIVFILSLLLSGRLRSIRINRQCLPFYGSAALVSVAAQMITFTALSRGQVSVVVTLVNTTPLFIVLFTAVFLRELEKINRMVAIGVVVLMAGVALIANR